MKTLLLALSCLLALTACGEQTNQSQPQASAASNDVSEEQQAAALARQQECEDATKPLLDKLHEVDSRLAVGLSVSEYGTLLGDVRVEYDGLDIDSLAPACLRQIAVPAERAFNRYLDAHDLWSDCIQDFACEMDSVDPKLQDKWQQAGDILENTDDNLNAMGRP